LKVIPKGKKALIEVLIEEPFHKVAESYSKRSSMPEKQASQDFELRNSIV